MSIELGLVSRYDVGGPEYVSQRARAPLPSDSVGRNTDMHTSRTPNRNGAVTEPTHAGDIGSGICNSLPVAYAIRMWSEPGHWTRVPSVGSRDYRWHDLF